MARSKLRDGTRHKLNKITDTARMRLWLFVIALYLTTLPVIAVPYGEPLRQEYGIKDYAAPPQHTAVLVDQAGVLYTANTKGVLRFDGDQWKTIELPGKAPARTLVQGNNGTLYVAAYDHLGLLQQNKKTGDWEYQSLLQKIRPEGYSDALGIVWAMFADQNGLWVHAEKNLLYFSYDYKIRKRWPVDENLRSFYQVNNTLYARIDNQGLMRFDSGRFELIPGGERFANKRVASMLADGKQILLISDDGFYRTGPLSIDPVFIQNKTRAGENLQGTLAYEALRLKDQSILVGTISGELFLFDANLTLNKRLPNSSFSVISMSADNDAGVWVATEGSLTRWSLPSAWSFIGAKQGLGGTALDSAWFDNRLWVGTTRGIYTFESSADGNLKAESKPWVDQEAYTLDVSAQGLLMGHRSGLMVLDPGNQQPRTLLDDLSEAVSLIETSPVNSGLRYALADERAYLLVAKNQQWQIAGAFEFEGMAVNQLVELSPGELWLSDSRGGVQRFLFDHQKMQVTSRKRYGPEQGLDFDPNFGTSLLELDKKLYVISGERIFIKNGDRFQPFSGPPLTLVDKPHELQIEQTPVGTYALTTNQLWWRKTPQAQWQELKLSGEVARGFRNLRYLSNGNVVMSTWTGLLVQDPEQALTSPRTLQLRFDKVAAIHLQNGEEQQLPTQSSGQDYIDVPAGHRVFFRFASGSLLSPAEYRYRVLGLADQWGPWTDRELYVRSATPGEYVLEVEARTQDGSKITPAQYRFRILPLWYEQWWLRLLAGLILALVIAWLTYRLLSRRTARFKEQNALLEQRIADRTQELEQLNRKLSELATEDPLTGVLNRRALEQGMSREWLRCMDQQRPLSVLMIDVDHFKRYNDQHGHLEGDAKLHAIAQFFQQNTDPQRELLARYGGEEFCLLLPSVPLGVAVQRGEKIRLDLVKAMPETTISIGVASLVPSLHLEQSTLVRRADAALYVAKRNGRNRVEYENSDNR
jgi:diguanylate cyclase (GGDEF)-like protein